MVVVDGEGIPLGNHVDSASPSEVTLLEKTIDNIADKGYDSGALRYRRLGVGST
jgi:transposase